MKLRAGSRTFLMKLPAGSRTFFSKMKSQDVEKLETLILSQGNAVRDLKKQQANKDVILAEVAHLSNLKKELVKLLDTSSSKFNRTKMEELMVGRFFYTPSFHIYGGISGLYDYGPCGCNLQNNILAIWRNHFVLEDDMLEIECSNLTPEDVFKTSGHVERFTDDMVKDTLTGDIFRADHLVKQVINQRLDDDKTLRAGGKLKSNAVVLDPAVKHDYLNVLETLDNYQGDLLHQLIIRLNILAPETGNALTPPVKFNLMFETQIGPTGQFRGFLRPETAQGHFLNFKKLLEFNTDKMPFASASIGKSFRNEISPRQGLLRVREFTMAEIEHYVDPLKKDHARFNEVADIEILMYSKARQMDAAGPVMMKIGDAVKQGIINNQTLGYFIGRIYLFLIRIGINKDRLRFRQHMENEMAHYACDCWDAEIESSYGWIESVGCADRSAYDLTKHSERTGEKLIVRESLPEPIIIEGLVLNLNKKVLGPAFKKNAKSVEAYFESLKISEDEWNQDVLAELQTNLTSGKAVIIGSDKKEYEITNDMISIELKTIKKNIREYTPNVIEPSFGIGRILYALLEHSYYTRKGDEQRAVLKFPPTVAPTKALIAPISHNEKFVPFINKIASALRRLGVSTKIDDSGVSIGRRYARNDELGTPFAITIDFDTVADSSVTLRERDSTNQIRASISVITELVKNLAEEKITWSDVIAKHPILKSVSEE